MIFCQKPKGVNQVRFFYSAIFCIALLIFSSFSIKAQENEPVVIDEVVAQVNDGVITLSRINREMKELIAQIAEQNKQPIEKVKAEVEAKKGEYIANLINEELLLQQGKELGVEQQVDAEINKRFLQIMKEQNLKTLEQLFTTLRSQGYNPDDIRENWRKDITKSMVLEREVDQKIYWGWGANEIRKYWETNKSKFTKPEQVTISEIFLNFAGRDMEATRAKAKQLVAQLRNGADFEKLAVENSDREGIQQNKGKVGKFSMAELNENFAKPIKATKVGGVTDPVEVEGGIEIFRVDAREEASQEAFFDESEVRRAMTVEKIPSERKKFVSELRKDAYIELAESYRAMVLPHLNKDEVTAEVTKPANN